MSGKKTGPVRLNIYIHDAGIRRHIKAAAAKKDVSISEYCFQAITQKLMKEEEMDHERKTTSLKDAVEKAYQFQRKAFKGKVFTVSSADLIQESRKDRNAL
ncbi:MAG: hypothetical protein KGZ49_02995 [Syntrophaceae bacterium]|nr:hypothetical protein [Syntrophaceae bacterium]